MKRQLTSFLAFVNRRCPWEAIRWRLTPRLLKSCREVYQTPRFANVLTRGGFTMEVNLQDWLGRHIYATGEYEPATSELLGKLLQKGDRFVDVGANAGYFTLLGASLVGESGAVVAFEPVPEMRQLLESNIARNLASHRCAPIDVRGVALSNSKGRMTFFVGPVDHRGISSLRDLPNAERKIEVEVAVLDDLLPTESVKVIKIDVEGAECHVLEGMPKLLERCHPDVILEVTPEYLLALERTPRRIQTFLESFGYRAYHIGHHGLTPAPDLAAVADKQFNALFTVNESMRLAQ